MRVGGLCRNGRPRSSLAIRSTKLMARSHSTRSADSSGYGSIQPTLAAWSSEVTVAPRIFVGSAMRHTGKFVLRRQGDPVCPHAQQILRTLAAQKAVGRCEPIGQAPVILASVKNRKDLGQSLQWRITGGRIERIGRKIIDAEMAQGENRPSFFQLFSCALGSGMLTPSASATCAAVIQVALSKTALRTWAIIRALKVTNEVAKSESAT